MDCLEPSVRSTIISHGPKTLDEVRVLADPVHASASVNLTMPQQKDESMQQSLSLLQTLVTQKSPGQTEPRWPVLPRPPTPRQPFQPSSTGTPRPIRGLQPGLKVIKPEFIPQAANHCALFWVWNCTSRPESCWRYGGRSCSPNTCPAMGKTCHFCLKPNHFQSVCSQAFRAEQQKQHTQ